MKETAFVLIDQCTKEALKQGTNVREGCEPHTGTDFLPDPENETGFPFSHLLLKSTFVICRECLMKYIKINNGQTEGDLLQ